jgi:hypothetical protein
MTPKQTAVSSAVNDAVRLFEAPGQDLEDECRIAQTLYLAADRHTEVLRRSKEELLNSPNVIR